ncbi:MAG: LysR family transcriptional regulator [Alphaproteobacteria bacterium]|nr:LysR family transcriptional regulator [Alphaproteobacteria bacterium]
MSPINLKQLEAFRAFFLAGTVSGAASLLDVSQPAVSRLLAQLERGLNLALFDRGRGRLVPTPEAHLLYDAVERAFLSVDKIKQVAEDIRTASAGHLQIAALPALALGFVPRAIARFGQAHPGVSVSLGIAASPRIEDLAASQQVDIGLAEYPFQGLGVAVEDFCRAPYVLVVPRAHAFASRRSVQPRDLAGLPFVSQPRSSVGRHLVDQVFERAGVRRQLVAETPYFAAVCALVLEGVGVGLVDPFTASDHRSRGLVAVPFRPRIDLHVGILHPAHRPLSRAAREFLAVLRACRAELRLLASRSA